MSCVVIYRVIWGNQASLRNGYETVVSGEVIFPSGGRTASTPGARSFMNHVPNGWYSVRFLFFPRTLFGIIQLETRVLLLCPSSVVAGGEMRRRRTRSKEGKKYEKERKGRDRDEERVENGRRGYNK